MSSKVTVQGNFFDHRSKNFAKALNDSLLDVGAFGAKDVKRQLTRGHGFQTGYLKGAVGFGLVKNFLAQIDAGDLHKGRNVIYAGWVEGVSTRNKTSVFKGYKMFHKTAKLLQSGPRAIKDIMEYHVKRNLN